MLEHAEDDPCPGQLVFPSPRGSALDSNNVIERHFRPAMVRAGLDASRLDGRQHDLRHTFITWCITDGMSAEEVGPIVGHSSAWITRRYTHLLGTHTEKARQAMNARGAKRGPVGVVHEVQDVAVGQESGPRSGPRPRLRVVKKRS